MKRIAVTSFLVLLIVLFFNTSRSEASFTFSAGNYYSSNNFSLTITEYQAGGVAVGSLTLPASLGSEIRGMAFGPDHLLYATLVTSAGFAVVALDKSGRVHQKYAGNVYIEGNLGFGKIAMDDTYLYVGGQDTLTRFALGDPASGTVIYSNNQVFDVKILPSGNLLVASAYQVDEITNSGVFVRTINLKSSSKSFVDIRGIEYNSKTDRLFVTALGYTGFFHKIMRLNATTGALEKTTTFIYGNDMFLTETGTLLVGSWTQIPEFFDQNLNSLGKLGTSPQMFVTQFFKTKPPKLQ